MVCISRRSAFITFGEAVVTSTSAYCLPDMASLLLRKQTLPKAMPFCSERWDRVHQPLSIRVFGVVEEIPDSRSFNDLPEVHNHHVIGHAAMTPPMSCVINIIVVLNSLRRLLYHGQHLSRDGLRAMAIMAR
jgi:hypothetical protein